MASGGVLVALLLISTVFGVLAGDERESSETMAGSRKMLTLGFGARPGYGYGYGLPRPGYGKPGYSAGVAPPARQAPPTTGFPGPVIAVEPKSLSSESDKQLARVPAAFQELAQDFPGPVIAF